MCPLPLRSQSGHEWKIGDRGKRGDLPKGKYPEWDDVIIVVTDIRGSAIMGDYLLEVKPIYI